MPPGRLTSRLSRRSSSRNWPTTCNACSTGGSAAAALQLRGWPPESGDVVRLRPDQLIILEGIHGLNPRLIPAALEARSFKVYASALTQLNLDRHNRVSTTDTRLIRRIVRDARDRGYSAADTISRWESVRRGERLHIFPYQENADAIFNSALAYELSVLRPLAEPLLRQVTHGTPESVESRASAGLAGLVPAD